MTPANRAGLVTFSGVLFIAVGLFNVLDGVVALVRPELFYVGENDFIVKNYDAYGVSLIVLGGLTSLIGFGILNRARPAQIAGIVVAGLGFLIHLAYFKHYPAWSAATMVIEVVVIYGLTVHSDQFKATRR